MLDLPFKALPPALLAGLLLYAGVTALWLQPLVEERLTAKVYRPQCEAGLIEADASQRRQAESERTARSRALNVFRNSPLGQLPGFEDALSMTEELADAANGVVPDRLTDPRIDHSSRCACAITSAFDEMRLSMLVHVMTGRLYRPAALGRLPASVSAFLAAPSCNAG